MLLKWKIIYLQKLNHKNQSLKNQLKLEMMRILELKTWNKLENIHNQFIHLNNLYNYNKVNIIHKHNHNHKT